MFKSDFKMNCISLFGIVLAVSICYVDCEQSCSSGTCSSLLDCPGLLSVVNKKDRTPQEIKLLQDSQCGYEGKYPKVCCPDSCHNPDGKAGSCVNIYQCAHLANMLKPPLSRPDNMIYVQNSRCPGSDPLSVCCGPPRVINKSLNTQCTGIVTAFPPDPKEKPTCCGRDAKTGDKISGGYNASIDQFSWLALIEYSKDNGPIKTLCGGSLISGRYVLTAAHCVTGSILTLGSPKNVRLAEYDTSNPGKDCSQEAANGVDCNDGTVTIPIEKTIPHPEFNKKNSKHDIALIRLVQSAPFTYFIRPICLPTEDYALKPPNDFPLFAAGWGAVSETELLFSPIKQFVDLPFVSQDKCQAEYVMPGRSTTLSQGQICAGGELGKDSCRGDSGGPLMYMNPVTRLYEVVGVVSFGPTPCGLPNVPGVYTNVFTYKDWIMSQIRE